jgi:hypothetical protein
VWYRCGLESVISYGNAGIEASCADGEHRESPETGPCKSPLSPVV